jgi:hypothetical protein
MDTKYETEGGPSGLSTGHLLFVFLVGVAVCAVFFSLGFLVGYNERSIKEVVVSERVTSPPVIPPTVVPPPLGAVEAPKEMAPPTAGMDSPTGSPGARTREAPPVSAMGSKHVSPPTAGASPPKPPAAAGGLASSPAAPGREVGVGITLQVAASRSPEYAHAKDNLYRVQVGPFRSSDEAEKVRKKLVQEGLKPFIRR